VPQAVHLLEGARVGDGRGGVVGEGAQPAELLPRDVVAAEEGEHAQNPAAEHERLTAEADDALPLGPGGIRQPAGPLGDLEQERLAGRRDLAHLPHPDREPAEPTARGRPRLAPVEPRGAGARLEVQALLLVGTLRSHPAIAADVARPHEPDASQRHPRLAGEVADDLRQHQRGGERPRHVQRRLLQALDLHGGEGSGMPRLVA